MSIQLKFSRMVRSKAHSQADEDRYLSWELRTASVKGIFITIGCVLGLFESD